MDIWVRLGSILNVSGALGILHFYPSIYPESLFFFFKDIENLEWLAQSQWELSRGL